MRRIIVDLKNEENIDDHFLSDIAEKLKSRIIQTAAGWTTLDFYKPHSEIIDRAIERYINNDYISAASILYPRIEGILRSMRDNSNKSQKEMSKAVVTNYMEKYPHSSSLPSLFERYLQQIYFANFDPANPSDISRNTVSHGVAPVSLFNLKSSTIGLLVIEQICSFVSNSLLINSEETLDRD